MAEVHGNRTHPLIFKHLILNEIFRNPLFLRNVCGTKSFKSIFKQKFIHFSILEKFSRTIHTQELEVCFKRIKKWLLDFLASAFRQTREPVNHPALFFVHREYSGASFSPEGYWGGVLIAPPPRLSLQPFHRPG